MKYSKYQKYILDTLPQKENGIYKISALAGTGKTTTAKSLLQLLPEKKWLVLVFNKDNKDEWRKWQQKNMKETIGNSEAHSFASFVMKMFPGYQWDWIKKPTKNDYKSLLENESERVIFNVKHIVDRFEISLAENITQGFVGTVLMGVYSAEIIEKYNRLANKLWNAKCDPSQQQFSLSESAGMKLIYLKKEILPYDFVIWDEAQDIPDIHFAVMNKFKQQSVHVLFGDDYQTINLWRSGMNGQFNKLESMSELPQTYRFGKTLACFVNSLMYTMDDIDLRKYDISIKGNADVKTWVIDYNSLQSIPVHKHGYILYLVRANKTMILTLFYYGKEIQKTHHIDCKFTKTKAHSKQFLVNLRELIEIKNEYKRFKYPSIWWKYNSWSDFQIDYESDNLTETQMEIASLVVGRLGNIRTYLKLQEIINNNDKKKPKFELSTVHGKKGAESDVVIVANDFLINRVTSNDFEEYCIFNTAITRAKKFLYYPSMYNELRDYQKCVSKIEISWIAYKLWKKTCIEILQNRLPIELCEYIMKK